VNGAPGPPRSACRGQLLGYRLQSLRGKSCCSLRSPGISSAPRPRGGEIDLMPVVSSYTGRARAGVRASRRRARAWRRPRPGSPMEERPRREDVQPDQGHRRRGSRGANPVPDSRVSHDIMFTDALNQTMGCRTLSCCGSGESRKSVLLEVMLPAVQNVPAGRRAQP
jgi:hypothetical protein